MCLRQLAFLSLLVMLTGCQAATVPTALAPTSSESASTSESTKPEVSNPVVSFMAVSQSKQPLSNAVVTFGQPFVPGDVPGNDTVQAITFDGRKLPTQVDWKATNQDGSRRHGIITVALPKMSPDNGILIGLYNTPGERGGDDSEPASAAVPKDINARVELDINGEPYTASFQKLAAAGVDRVWLSGPLVTEWHVSGSVVSTTGQPNDRVFVQIYVRHYAAANKTRVVFVIENDWTFKPLPRNITYDARLFLNDEKIYTYDNLTHAAHSRWRKAFWVGDKPKAYVRHDLNYLKATGTIPNYDPDLRVPASTVKSFYQFYLESDRDPMDVSIVVNPMNMTGGRPEIGPLPKWTVFRLLTMSPRMIKVDRGVSSLAGSWTMHLRDEKTGLPVTLADYPYLTTHPNLVDWDKNPLPDKTMYEGRPNDLIPDWNHEPSFAFVPYLLSGDYYFLEELMFWAAWNPLRTSPAYRDYGKGLFKWMQVRGQAWSLRTLGQVSYITPDGNPLKGYWKQQLQNNLAWYNKHYSNNPNANKLGFLVGLMPYNHGRALAPWQDDFFTWAISYLVKLGFDNARPMLDFKVKFPVGRMVAPGYCWVFGAIYYLNVRESEDRPFYHTFARAYEETVNRYSPNDSIDIRQLACGSQAMADQIGSQYKAGDMTGYPWSAQGYPSNMQPALAAAVDAGLPSAKKAWKIFMNRTRKPDYSSYPNWAIVPEK